MSSVVATRTFADVTPPNLWASCRMAVDERSDAGSSDVKRVDALIAPSPPTPKMTILASDGVLCGAANGARLSPCPLRAREAGRRGHWGAPTLVSSSSPSRKRFPSPFDVRDLMLAPAVSPEQSSGVENTLEFASPSSTSPSARAVNGCPPTP